jgi:N-methylhydantoinase A
VTCAQRRDGDGSGYRIAVDIGGTFTDVVVYEPAGVIRIGKGSTAVRRAFEGIREALEQLVPELGMSVEEILAATESLSYGTTRALNAIVEGKTARTAFFTTGGFPDTLLLREGGKRGRFTQMQYQDPYVPRYLTFEIDERMTADGQVAVPLDEGTVLEAIEEARAHSCEAVGVCFIWSISNPAHEERVADLLEAHLPGIPYTLSHRLNPIVREYRRASATVIDASLKGLMQEHLLGLESDLRRAGFDGELLVATSFGGSWRPAELIERPIYAIGSGPSMAPVAGVTYGSAELNGQTVSTDLLVCDAGGTTFDIALVSGGEIQHTSETWIGGQWTGHITGIRSVDIKSLGAGGGSIAWIDSGGLLRVGPQSAGADPGPACYRRGGTAPTVTDAAVVLGYLDAGYFLGGHLGLAPERARAAIATTLTEPLGLTVEEAAHAVLVVATTNVVGAIRGVTISQGLDPREMTIVAGGGASGLNIVSIARELGCRQVLLPRTAGAFSAVGALHADLISEFARSVYCETRSLDATAVNATLELLERRARGFLDGVRDLRPVETRIEFSVDARYPGQVWDINIALPWDRMRGGADLEALEREFHASHQRIFAVNEPGQYLECLTWKARATASLRKPALALHPAAASAPPECKTAPAYFGAGAMVDVPRYDGRTLHAGMRIRGPAVVNEPTTTVVLDPLSAATVTRSGSYLIDVAAHDEAEES